MNHEPSPLDGFLMLAACLGTLIWGAVANGAAGFLAVLWIQFFLFCSAFWLVLRLGVEAGIGGAIKMIIYTVAYFFVIGGISPELADETIATIKAIFFSTVHASNWFFEDRLFAVGVLSTVTFLSMGLARVCRAAGR